ncbi:MAG: uroporphyrinogen-III synthase [Roseovarius sp.]
MAASILITRPAEAAERLAEELAARLGAQARLVISPLMRIETLPEAVPGPGAAGTLVLTSAHAVAAIRAALAGASGASGAPGASGASEPFGPPAARCYCVGTATAAAARALGLEAVDGGGSAESLLARLCADRPPGPILYLRGEHVAADLAAQLRAAGLAAHQAVVYRQRPLALTAEARALLDGPSPVIVPLFSPRSAALFFAAAQGAAPLYLAAISHNVAARVPPGRAARLVVAPAPDGAAMLATIAALASQINRVESAGRAK